MLAAVDMGVGVTEPVARNLICSTAPRGAALPHASELSVKLSLYQVHTSLTPRNSQ